MKLHISNDPPTSRAFLEAASLDIASVLHSYIAIHNDIFRISLRRILPLPLFFHGIDFDGYFCRLYYLCETLTDIVKQLPAQGGEAPELLEIIKSYSDALCATMSSLREICGSLMARAVHGTAYSWTAYRRDLKRYHEHVALYRQIGSNLNILLTQPKDILPPDIGEQMVWQITERAGIGHIFRKISWELDAQGITDPKTRGEALIAGFKVATTPTWGKRLISLVYSFAFWFWLAIASLVALSIYIRVAR